MPRVPLVLEVGEARDVAVREERGHRALVADGGFVAVTRVLLVTLGRAVRVSAVLIFCRNLVN